MSSLNATRPAPGFTGAICALVIEALAMPNNKKFYGETGSFGDNVGRDGGRGRPSLTFFLRSSFTPGCVSDLPGVPYLLLCNS